MYNEEPAFANRIHDVRNTVGRYFTSTSYHHSAFHGCFMEDTFEFPGVCTTSHSKNLPPHHPLSTPKSDD